MSDFVLQRVAAGDMAAMQDCIDTYGGLVWSLARRFTPSAAEAEDAVQEVFIALWENAGRFDEAQGTEVTFVAMIARRRLIDRGRKRERQKRLLTNLKESKEAEVETATSNPAAKIDEADRAMAALQQLSPPQQRVLRLSIHQGYTHEQIAECTGFPLGTVKTHARRGLQRIREILKTTDSGKTIGAKP
ncbi:MAG: RNA polymerase sigma factor [Planctomycetota bacterium]